MKQIIAMTILALILTACDNTDNLTGPNDTALSFLTVKSGDNFTIGINSDHSVWAWGTNNQGVLGINKEITANSEVPVKISGLENIIEIAAGSQHAIALSDNGKVYSWGANDRGQLGLGYVYNSNSTPSVVGIKETVKMITSGKDFTFAVTKSGKVYTWGSNAYNCQGHDLLLVCPTPVLSLMMANINKIVIDGYSCMAMDTDGNVWTWGNNTNNRLGREYEPFSGDGTRPAISEKLGKVTDVGFDRNFYVIDGNGKRTDIVEQGEPAL